MQVRATASDYTGCRDLQRESAFVVNPVFLSDIVWACPWEFFCPQSFRIAIRMQRLCCQHAKHARWWVYTFYDPLCGGSVPLVREAIMILYAISRQVNLSGLLSGIHVLFSQATSKLVRNTHAELISILPTIQALQKLVMGAAVSS